MELNSLTDEHKDLLPRFADGDATRKVWNVSSERR